jgi:hypothetical protein
MWSMPPTPFLSPHLSSIAISGKNVSIFTMFIYFFLCCFVSRVAGLFMHRSAQRDFGKIDLPLFCKALPSVPNRPAHGGKLTKCLIEMADGHDLSDEE